MYAPVDELGLQENADIGTSSDSKPLAAMTAPLGASSRSVSEGITSSGPSASGTGDPLPVARRIVSASETMTSAPPPSPLTMHTQTTPMQSRDAVQAPTGEELIPAGLPPVMMRAASDGASTTAPNDLMELRKLRAMKYQNSSSNMSSANPSADPQSPSSHAKQESKAEAKSD